MADSMALSSQRVTSTLWGSAVVEREAPPLHVLAHMARDVEVLDARWAVEVGVVQAARIAWAFNKGAVSGWTSCRVASHGSLGRGVEETAVTIPVTRQLARERIENG